MTGPAIYELLPTIDATQKRQGNRLNEIAATQADHGQKLDGHGRMLSDHGQKLDAILDLLRGNQSS